MNHTFLQRFQNTNELEATFYMIDVNGNEEDPITLPVGDYDSNSLNAIGISGNSIYRVDVPNGLEVSLFSKNLFSGDNLVLKTSSSSLGNLDKKTISLIINNSDFSINEITPNVITPSVSRPNVITPSISRPNVITPSVNRPNVISPSVFSNEIIIYSEDEDGNESTPVALSEGAYNAEELSDLGIINDGIFKIDLPNGLMVTLFSEDLFTGTPYIVTSSSSFELDNPTYSIIVNKNLINSNKIIATPSQLVTKINISSELQNKNILTPVVTVISSLYKKFDSYVKNNFKVKWIKGITNTNLIISSIFVIFILLLLIKKRRQ